MSVVWKFELGAQGVVSDIEMPEGAEVVHVAEQNGRGCMWAIVDPDADTETRTFAVVGTGWVMPPYSNHIGTYLEPPFVWHVFERVAS